MSFGFVVGNGESRLAVPARMLEHKEVYACNLAYRQFKVKELVCCDKRVLATAVSEGANLRARLWTRSRWFSQMDLPGVHVLPENFPWPENNKHDQYMNWGSGTYAALLACRSDHEILVFIGFDLWSKNGKVNNVFKGENGYGPKDADAVGPEGWIHQLDLLMRYYPEKQFVFLNEKGWEPPQQWVDNDNFNSDELKQLRDL